MVKLFVTGDNHFGRKFDKYPVKDILIESRFKCFEKMIRTAEKEHCSFFVITGDLFDNTYAVSKKDINRITDMLGSFDRTVLVLPGNHDFYSGKGNEALWNDFTASADRFGNIILLNEYRRYSFECSGQTVNIYPAYCDSKHSETNRLDWIKAEENIPADAYNIGIAHGALEGLAIDTEGLYFPMGKAELNSINMDLWLLGHAHVTYPDTEENIDVPGTVFNPGSHEQLDLHNNTEGNSFVISLSETDGIKKVSGRKLSTGNIRYYDEKLVFSATDRKGLEEAIRDLTDKYKNESVLRLTLSGSIDAEEYLGKETVYKKILSRFLYYSIVDSDLNEKITREKIEREFSEVGFTAKFLEGLLDDPIELQMAYDAVKSLKRGESL